MISDHQNGVGMMHVFGMMRVLGGPSGIGLKSTGNLFGPNGRR